MCVCVLSALLYFLLLPALRHAQTNEQSTHLAGDFSLDLFYCKLPLFRTKLELVYIFSITPQPVEGSSQSDIAYIC